MGKLRTQQNRLVNILDSASYPLMHDTALVVAEFRHYDASTELYFQYLEIMSNTRGLERYFRMIPIKEAETFNPDMLIPKDLSVRWNICSDGWAEEGTFIIRELVSHG